MPRWLQVVSGLALLTLFGLIVVLLVRWPYRQTTVLQSLQQSFSSQIHVSKYHLVFFPSPGFVAEGLTLHRSGAEDLPPLATIVRLQASSSYATILFAPRRFQTLQLEGLHVQIPPAGSSNASGNDNSEAKRSTMFVAHLIADGAQLDITRHSGEPPLHFDIHRLRLDHVGATRAIAFSTTLIEPVMKGEVQSQGSVGPIDIDDPGKTPVDATYKLAGADLGVFGGVSGTVSSSGKFSGRLGHIDTQGIVDTPDFRVKDCHAVHLTSRYKAVVNGTKADVSLPSVVTQFDRTTVFMSGNIAGDPNLAALNFNVDRGRVQDLLSIFVKEAPPMDGIITIKANALLPSSQEPFLKRLRMEGDFNINGGRFTKPETRQKVDAFSERTRMEKPPKDDPNPPPVIGEAKGHAVVKDGVATFTTLSFTIPGATAQLSGTFNLIDQTIHLTGDLQTQTDISHTTTGIKAVLLKPLVPFFKKKNKTSVMPIQVTGTWRHVQVGARLVPKDK